MVDITKDDTTNIRNLIVDRRYGPAAAPVPTPKPPASRGGATADARVKKPNKVEKPDKAGAIADVAARIQGGQEKRDACKEVFRKYGYKKWQTLETAYERSVARGSKEDK